MIPLITINGLYQLSKMGGLLSSAIPALMTMKEVGYCDAWMPEPLGFRFKK